MDVPRRCTPDEASILAGALADEPETVFARQRLSRGLCPAFLIGEPAKYVAAIVEALPGTLFAFGADPRALWELIQPLQRWTSVIIAPDNAGELGALIEGGTGQAVAYEETVHYTLPSPVVSFAHAAVRLMTPADAEMVASGPGGSVGAAYGSVEALLAEGYVAGAVIAGVLVARAHTSCQSSGYADVAVATLEQWRGNGLATAAASLVCEQVRRSGRTPVWSTSSDNLASRRIARKLGFVVHAHVTTIVPKRLMPPGQ